MKRKNRVVVEYTAEKPISQKEAQKRIGELLVLGLGLVREKPLWWRFNHSKFSVKEFGRVLRAELRRNSP